MTLDACLTFANNAVEAGTPPDMQYILELV
jgi:hypothetical protein